MSNEQNNAKWFARRSDLAALESKPGEIKSAFVQVMSYLPDLVQDRYVELVESTPPAAATAPASTQDEPFGYFRAEPMGWTDCAADDEGAIALYERPAAPAVPQDSDPTSKEQYRRMFGAACEALGSINDALGCDPEDGGAEPILGAVEELKISLGLSNGILGCLGAKSEAPAEIDVRTILLDIVPGDGNGYEVYAKNVDDVVNRLTMMGEQLEAAEMALANYTATPATPSQEPVTLTDGQALKDAFEEGYCSRSTYNDVDISDVETEWAKSSAKASIAALREKEARK